MNLEETITLDQFYEYAKTISSDPKSRLTSVTKEVIERNNFIFDAHCHIFDGDCISLRYMLIRFTWAAGRSFIGLTWKMITGNEIGVFQEVEEIIEKLYDKERSGEIKDEPDYLDRIEQNILNEIESKKDEIDDEKQKFLNKLLDIIRLLKSKSMEVVYKKYREEYSIDNVIAEDKELLTVVLGMDLDKGWDGNIQKSNLEQIDELNSLAIKYPIIPFLPLDPRRMDDVGANNLLNVFLRGFAQESSNYFGVKIYPSLGYLPGDIRLDPIFKICAEKNIPVVTHCGGNVVSTFKHKIEVNRLGETFRVPGLLRHKRAAYLNEPKEWEYVLNRHPNLRLDLGHFGSAKAWSKSISSVSHRKDVIFHLMSKFNVYADFSFNIEDEEATLKFSKRLRNDDEIGKLMQKRSLFGTDFWVVLPMSDLIAAQKNFIAQVKPYSENLLLHNVRSFLQI